jgi:hypothetical protein
MQDGSESIVALHPNYSNVNVSIASHELSGADVQPPEAGIGKSDGRGTFKKFKNNAIIGTYKFDGNKSNKAASR